MSERVCGYCGGFLLEGVAPMEPPEFCPNHPGVEPVNVVERMTGDEARAEVERLQKIMEQDTQWREGYAYAVKVLT